MRVIEKQTLDKERALYGSKDIIINECILMVQQMERVQ